VGLYYYLMSQLPSLMYDQKPPMSSEAFKELASLLLSKKDASLLKYLSLQLNNDVSSTKKTVSTGCSFIDDWRDWEKTLRLNLARYRYLELQNKKSPNDYKNEAQDGDKDTYFFENMETFNIPVLPADAYNTASVVFTQEGSPLDGEILIDKARWNAIDLMAGNEYFDRNNVYAYFLKLLILERRQLFIVEKGFSEYKTIYSQIINSSSNESSEPRGDFYQESQNNKSEMTGDKK